ncbi:MAG TPA: PASTA domain-containing protein [Edaphocola sp.]|nr:PASTA domain-containing protein [Edaphocola sp.]
MKKLLSSFWFNLLLIIGLCFLLYFAFFASLSQITRHGDELTVPDIKGKSAVEAVAELKKMGFEVVVDSTYDTLAAPLTILDVQPEFGATVKRGRSIFLTINKQNPPEIEMPNLLNLSLRSAVILLRNNKLEVGDTIYKPDMAKGAVLAQLWNGQPVPPGQKLPQGTTIDLVIGDGYSKTSIPVPNLINLTFTDAKFILDSLNLFYTDVWDGRITDSSTAVVYFQMPLEKNEQGYPNTILAGENIDIRIRQFSPKPEDSLEMRE